MVQNEVGWLRCFGKETVTQVLGEADLQADLPMRMLHPHDATTKKRPHRKTGGERGAGGVRGCCAGGMPYGEGCCGAPNCWGRMN